MENWHLVAITFATIFFSNGTTNAEEPKKSPQEKINALIDQLMDVSRQGTGYSSSSQGTMFLPLGFGNNYVMLYGKELNAESAVMRSLVEYGLTALPALLEHLSDDRKTKIVIRNDGLKGRLVMVRDKREKTEEKIEILNNTTDYEIRVGDLCYVALGQIVNREYRAIQYQTTSIVDVISLPQCQQLRTDLIREWSGLTPEKHRDILIRELDSDIDAVRTGASVRLAFYYPDSFEVHALRQLNRPIFSADDVYDLLIYKVYQANTADERKKIIDEFVKKYGNIAREGILWILFQEIDHQFEDEKTHERSYKARECLIDVFGYKADVKRENQPKRVPLDRAAQTLFMMTLLYDRSEKIDKFFRDTLAKTEADFLAEVCMRRLAGRGYDADISAYLKKRLHRLQRLEYEKLNINEMKLGWTRLHAAVHLNAPYLIEQALKDNLDINAQSKYGQTALHLAASTGKNEAVEILLKANADPNVKDVRNKSPVQSAAEADYPETVRRLVAGKCEVQDLFSAVIIGDESRVVGLIQRRQELIRERTARGWSPLHIATREGHVDMMLKLIDAGAEINDVDSVTKTYGFSEGWTPLFLAVIQQNEKAVTLLLDKGAKVNTADNRGKLTPLHYASLKGNAEIVKRLLAKNANRDLKDQKGRTALDLAKERDNNEVVKLLEDSK